MNRSDNNHEPLDHYQAPGDLVEQVARGRTHKKVHHYYTTDRLTMQVTGRGAGKSCQATIVGLCCSLCAANSRWRCTLQALPHAFLPRCSASSTCTCASTSSVTCCCPVASGLTITLA